MKQRIYFFMIFIILLSFFDLCYGQTDIQLKGIGGKLGFIDPELGVESAWGIGIVADLGTITPEIHLGAYVEYWSKSYGNPSANYSVSDFAFGGMGKYYFKLENMPVQLYAGGGIGLTRWHNDTNLSLAEDSGIDLGFRVFGGAEYQINKQFVGFGEILYHSNGFDYLGIFIGVMKSLKQ